ncbi:MAG: thymidylate synthase [Sulfuricaulis sp.]|nr:thymidylate synthase [Sulfuricaulis sp.]
MRILRVRNVHEALPHALQLLDQEGVERPSRNGPVLLGPSVTTIYERPCERVLFWPERDANPFFHLYESLWMLAGRNDVAGPARYTKNIANYSDDGTTFHGAYGERWRRAFLVPNIGSRDQLIAIVRRLKANPDDRRCALQIWSTTLDLDNSSKDVCCNLTATFQRGFKGELNLVVFCRSNDIVWGAYGANAVHFSFLLEYMALWIDCPVGTYTQVSVNWHGYLSTLEKVKNIRPDHVNFVENPYRSGLVHSNQMFHCPIEEANKRIGQLLFSADHGFQIEDKFNDDKPFFNNAYLLLRAHEVWRTYEGEKRYTEALRILALGDQRSDWIVAGEQWLQRRYDKWQLRP